MRLNVEGLNRPTGLQPERTAFPTKLDRRLGRRGFLIAGGAALAAAFLPPELRAQEIPPDFDVLGGHFFTQTRGDAPFPQGYLIKDDFYAAFLRMGGVSLNGYPVANEVIIAGLRSQPTQNIILQDNRELGFVPANTLDIAHDMGLDNFLYARGIPRKSTEDDGSDGDIAKATQVRLTWLTQPHIRDKYFQNPIAFFGLPTSRPEKIGPAIAQRFQRSAIMTVVEEAEGWPPVGTTLLMNVPDLLKQAGFFGPAAIPIDNPYGAGSGGGNGDGATNSTEIPTSTTTRIEFPKDRLLNLGPVPDRIGDLGRDGFTIENRGGKIGVVTTDQELLQKVVIDRLVAGGKQWEIRIYDNLNEVPEELKAKLVTPAYRGITRGCTSIEFALPWPVIKKTALNPFLREDNRRTEVYLIDQDLNSKLTYVSNGVTSEMTYQEFWSIFISSDVKAFSRLMTNNFEPSPFGNCEEVIHPGDIAFSSKPALVVTNR